MIPDLPRFRQALRCAAVQSRFSGWSHRNRDLVKAFSHGDRQRCALAWSLHALSSRHRRLLPLLNVLSGYPVKSVQSSNVPPEQEENI